MEAQNQKAIHNLCRSVKNMNKSLWIYSGYTWEQLTDQANSRCHVLDVTYDILSCADVLVDGEYKEEQKDISLMFRGSKNQRIIDSSKSLKSGRVILSGWMEKQYAQ